MNKRRSLFALTLIGVLVVLNSCANDSFNNIESDLLGENNYESGTYNADVSIKNISEIGIQTNGLNGYLLGKYTQSPFGTKNASILAQVVLPNVSPTFGSSSQTAENTNNYQENETATAAYLYIPFFSRGSSSTNNDGDTVTTYTLDSIFGNNNASFNIKVYESNYYLRDVDPTDNYSASQKYYSNLDISSYIGAELANQANYKISTEAIARNKFDDPITDNDESTEEFDKLTPGIRIPLDASFFQTKILDKEGADEFASADAFKKYFRGIYITTDNFSENLMMLLNFAKAKIEVVYTYNQTKDNVAYTQTSRYEMSLTGINVNLYDNDGESITADSDPYDVSRVYLSGGQGRVAEFSIFTGSQLAEIKQNNWLINDAVLKLYVDQSVAYAQEPLRLYIYNAETGRILVDYGYDTTYNSTTPSSSELIHLGKLQKEDDKGVYYELRLTNHVANIIRRDSTNVKLGIAVASNVNTVNAINYINESNEKKYTSITSTATPLSTVLYGNSSAIDEDKRLKLKITYSKIGK